MACCNTFVLLSSASSKKDSGVTSRFSAVFKLYSSECANICHSKESLLYSFQRDSRHSDVTFPRRLEVCMLIYSFDILLLNIKCKEL